MFVVHFQPVNPFYVRVPSANRPSQEEDIPLQRAFESALLLRSLHPMSSSVHFLSKLIILLISLSLIWLVSAFAATSIDGDPFAGQIVYGHKGKPKHKTSVWY